MSDAQAHSLGREGRGWRAMAAVAALVAFVVLCVLARSPGFGWGDATVLGIVEGVTEYLPVSSTGHLLLAERVLDLGQTKAMRDAAESFAIVIQLGAIVAVLGIYWPRIRSIVLGLFGKDPVGLRLLTRLLAAFLPAVLVALVFEDAIKERLFSLWAISAAWIVGGLVILAMRSTLDAARDPRVAGADHHGRGGLSLEEISVPTALWIGVAQTLAMWPGTSRSLVTILAAVALGLSLHAAVEFAFLLGLATLGAATVFEGAKSGGDIVHQFGYGLPILGIVVAAVTAAASVKWMLSYLERRSFAVFGWYRLAIGGITIVLLLVGTLKA